MLILCSYPDKPEGCESNSVNTLKQLIMQRDGAEEENSFSRYLDPQQSAAGFLSQTSRQESNSKKSHDQVTKYQQEVPPHTRHKDLYVLAFLGREAAVLVYVRPFVQIFII